MGKFKMCFIVLILFCSFSSSVFSEKLHVDGAVVRDNNNNPVVLKGVNLPELEWTNSLNWITLEKIKDIGINWDANLIRLPLNQEWYLNGSFEEDSYRYNVRKVVDWCKAYGIYVMLDLHWLEPSDGVGHDQAPKPDSKTEKFWSEVAKDYDDYDNVIYDLFNEPYNTSWKIWKEIAEGIIDEIEKQDSDAIYVVGGTDWGYNLSQVASDPVDNDNVIYSSHHYPWKTNTYDNLFGKYPIFIGEFGYWNINDPNYSSPGWEGNLDYVKDLIGNLNDQELGEAHYAAWSYHNSSAPTLISNSSLDRTDQGEVVYDDCRSSNLKKYVDKELLNVEVGKFSGKYIHLKFNKAISDIDVSNISISGYSVESVEVVGDYRDNLIITLDQGIGETSATINVDVMEYIGGKSFVNDVDISQHVVELPLKINVADKRSVDVPELGFVQEKPYYPGQSNWGTSWYDTHGGKNKTAVFPDLVFFNDDRSLNPVMGTMMYGFKGVHVTVPNGEYKVYIFSSEDKTFGPDSAAFGSHAYSVKANGVEIYDEIDAYKITNELNKVTICSLTVQVDNGLLEVELEGISDYPMVNAIVVGDSEYSLEYESVVSVLNKKTKNKNTQLDLYPNPFNPIVSIRYDVVNSAKTNVKIYNVNGQLIKVLSLGNENSSVLTFDMSDYESGIYYFSLENGDSRVMKRAVLIK